MAMTSEEKDLIELFWQDKTPISVIAKELGKHPSTIYNYLNRSGLRKIEHSEEAEEKGEEAKTENKDTKKETLVFDTRRELPVKENAKIVDRMYNIKRGDIYYVYKFGITDGLVQDSGRPAIVVSNNKNNMFSPTVEIVYLTTQPKSDMPTHVDICSSGVKSTAICEQIITIPRERIANPCGVCTDAEMKMIDAALAVSLGLDFEKVSAQTETKPEPQIMTNDKTIEHQTALVERNMYKKLYEELIEKLIKSR